MASLSSYVRLRKQAKGSLIDRDLKREPRIPRKAHLQKINANKSSESQQIVIAQKVEKVLLKSLLITIKN
ncbi:hypothetical protein TURTL08_14050 [Turicimonas sp. TL08]